MESEKNKFLKDVSQFSTNELKDSQASKEKLITLIQNCKLDDAYMGYLALSKTPEIKALGGDLKDLGVFQAFKNLKDSTSQDSKEIEKLIKEIETVIKDPKTFEEVFPFFQKKGTFSQKYYFTLLSESILSYQLIAKNNSQYAPSYEVLNARVIPGKISYWNATFYRDPQITISEILNSSTVDETSSTPDIGFPLTNMIIHGDSSGKNSLARMLCGSSFGICTTQPLIKAMYPELSAIDLTTANCTWIVEELASSILSDKLVLYPFGAFDSASILSVAQQIWNGSGSGTVCKINITSTSIFPFFKNSQKFSSNNSNNPYALIDYGSQASMKNPPVALGPDFIDPDTSVFSIKKLGGTNLTVADVPKEGIGLISTAKNSTNTTSITFHYVLPKGGLDFLKDGFNTDPNQSWDSFITYAKKENPNAGWFIDMMLNNAAWDNAQNPFLS